MFLMWQPSPRVTLMYVCNESFKYSISECRLYLSRLVGFPYSLVFTFA